MFEYEVNQALENTRNLKKYVRSIIDSTPAQHYQQGPWSYPEDVNEFKENFPPIYQQAFGDGQPAQSRWRREFRAMVAQMAPRRDTKSGVDKSNKGLTVLKT